MRPPFDVRKLDVRNAFIIFEKDVLLIKFKKNVTCFQTFTRDVLPFNLFLALVLVFTSS